MRKISNIQRIRDNREKLRELILLDYSEKELAEYFNCTAGTIIQAKKELELQSHQIRENDPKNRKHNITSCLICGKNSNKRTCRDCVQRRGRIAIKEILVESAGGKCIYCGYAKCIAAMDFHHRDPTQKELNLAMSDSCKNIQKKLDEIKKCDLICSNCHREEHWKTNLDFIVNNREAIDKTKGNILRSMGKRGSPKKEN